VPVFTSEGQGQRSSLGLRIAVDETGGRPHIMAALGADSLLVVIAIISLMISGLPMSRQGPDSRRVASAERPAAGRDRPDDVTRRHLEKRRPRGGRHADPVHRVSVCVSVSVRRVSAGNTGRRTDGRRSLPASNSFRVSYDVVHRHSEAGRSVSAFPLLVVLASPG